MELDDLKSAWQSLNETMARQNALNLRALKDQKLDKVRHGLRPLVWGQAIQIGLGALLALVSAGFWSNHRHVPHLLVTGLVMHAYGLAMILFGTRMQVLIGRIDFGAPVLEIQRRMAELRRFYGRGGLWIGLPWWVLWIVAMEMLFMGLFGADLYVNLSPAVTISQFAIGFLGWALTLAFDAWARRHPKFGPELTRATEGKNLTRAKAALEDIARFEDEAR